MAQKSMKSRAENQYGCTETMTLINLNADVRDESNRGTSKEDKEKMQNLRISKAIFQIAVNKGLAKKVG